MVLHEILDFHFSRVEIYPNLKIRQLAFLLEISLATVLLIADPSALSSGGRDCHNCSTHSTTQAQAALRSHYHCVGGDRCHGYIGRGRRSLLAFYKKVPVQK